MAMAVSSMSFARGAHPNCGKSHSRSWEGQVRLAKFDFEQSCRPLTIWSPCLESAKGRQTSVHCKVDSAFGDDLPNFGYGKMLSEISSWGIGGPAKMFVEVKTPTEMASVLRYCTSNDVRWFVVGKGSNCLFDDRGFDGCIILNRIEFLERLSTGLYRVGSGYAFNMLGVQCSREGFSGLEFAGGIPGTVGGAVYMNAGADGQETLCKMWKS